MRGFVDGLFSIDPGDPAAHGHATALGARALSLDLPSCPRTIEAVDAFVGEAAASAEFDADTTQDVQIAVREAVTTR